MNLRPLHDRVVIRQADRPTHRGNVLMPDQMQSRPREGEVLAVGPGKRDAQGRRIPMTLKPGDTVFWALGKGVKWKTPEGELLVMHESEVMGAIER